MNHQKRPHKRVRPAVAVVGIGASAGGLEAFTAFLKALRPDTGMAFVLISHLMHKQKSMLGELLSKATPMPVTQLDRRTVVQANHVYVIPPNKELSIGNGHLRVAPLTAIERPPMVIDRFFRSLAQARKSKAVGVILSGTGSDGTIGLAEIKGEGGITFVQDPATAAYGDMPRSAQSSADYVLPPQEIAKELKRIADHPYVSKAPPPIESAPQHDHILNQIFGLVRASGGVDFTHYKPASVRRRIARRMFLKNINSLSKYLEHLKVDNDEVTALYEDLLITVTEFFRDPDTFDVLKREIIPRILKRLPKDTPERVWVPGCASGEEAYSIAMCFVEVAKDRAAPPVQVFATDVSEQCIAKARRGLYPENIKANVSPDRLRRFFVKETDGYRVTKFIRDLCIFAEQDVIRDAPFSKMDLVSCRNLLIYLDTPTQKEVLRRFHYALQPAGVLFLGTSESIGAAPELFEQIHKPEKIYSRLPVATRVEFAPMEHVIAHETLTKERATDRPLPGIGKEVDQLLLRRFAPSAVLVNAAMEILEFRGPSSSVIEPRPGEASLNIFKMVRKELLVPLRVALHKAQTSSTPVRKEGLNIQVNHNATKLNLEIIRLSPETKGPSYYLILFEDRPFHLPANRIVAGKTSGTTVTPTDRRIAELEQELKSAQEHLTSIIEEQETTNEELQSANEEVLAGNEELQSMNEEMQTAREELQATNEELHSVNDELQRRITDLGSAFNDLNNLILSLDIASVLVDTDLRIRRFTALAQKLLNLIPGDVGRSIADIRPKIDIPDWPAVISEVIQTMSSAEQEIQDSDGHWYSMRVRLYKTEGRKIEGAVMYLVDIDKLKRAEEAMAESDRKWQKLVEELPDFILNPDGQILFINRTLISLAKDAKIGSSIFETIDAADQATLKTSLQNVQKSGQAMAFEVRGSGALQNATLETVITPIKSSGKLVAMTMLTKQLRTIANGRIAPTRNA